MEFLGALLCGDPGAPRDIGLTWHGAKSEPEGPRCAPARLAFVCGSPSGVVVSREQHHPTLAHRTRPPLRCSRERPRSFFLAACASGVARRSRMWAEPDTRVFKGNHRSAVFRRWRDTLRASRSTPGLAWPVHPMRARAQQWRNTPGPPQWDRARQAPRSMTSGHREPRLVA